MNYSHYEWLTCIYILKEKPLTFPWILSLHLISMNASPPPPPPPPPPQQKGGGEHYT